MVSEPGNARIRALSRRAVLRGLTAGAAALLAACGGGQANPTAPPQPAAPTAGAQPTAVGAAATRATAAAASPTAAAAAARPGGGSLRVAITFLPAGRDPAVGAQGSTVMAMGLGETLTRLTPQGELRPWLAESVEPVDPLRWRVHLHAGVTFHNGKPVDAAAVQRSLTRTVEKNAAAANLLQLAKADAPDARTVVIETKSPNGGVPAILNSFYLIIHDAEEATRVGDAAFGQNPVMTGPFQAADFRPSELSVVRRYDQYWGGAPALERAEFRNVADANARLAAVLAGDVEMARQIPPQGIAQVRGANLAVASVGFAGMYHIFLNNARPPLNDAMVRRAINLAVDRRTLVDRVLGGGEVARGVYPAYLPFAGPEPLPFDPARARQDLDEGGWRAGGDGIRAKDGARLEFETLTYPQRPELGLLATAIQAQLKDVGIAIGVRSVEDITKPVDAGDYSAAMYSFQTAPTGDPSYVMNTLYRSTGASNKQLGYQSPRLDAAADRLTAESDPARRIELAHEAQGILAEDVPAVYLMQPLYHTAHTPRLRGFEPHTVEQYLLNGRWSLA